MGIAADVIIFQQVMPYRLAVVAAKPMAEIIEGKRVLRLPADRIDLARVGANDAILGVDDGLLERPVGLGEDAMAILGYDAMKLMADAIGVAHVVKYAHQRLAGLEQRVRQILAQPRLPQQRNRAVQVEAPDPYLLRGEELPPVQRHAEPTPTTARPTYDVDPAGEKAGTFGVGALEIGRRIAAEPLPDDLAALPQQESPTAAA